MLGSGFALILALARVDDAIQGLEGVAEIVV